MVLMYRKQIFYHIQALLSTPFRHISQMFHKIKLAYMYYITFRGGFQVFHKKAVYKIVFSPSRVFLHKTAAASPRTEPEKRSAAHLLYHRQRKASLSLSGRSPHFSSKCAHAMKFSSVFDDIDVLPAVSTAESIPLPKPESTNVIRG